MAKRSLIRYAGSWHSWRRIIWRWRGGLEDYHINIFYNERDGGYIADIPALKHCSAFGTTPEDALRELEDARAAWLEAAQAEGRPITRPRYRPAIYQPTS